jgi:hypothetical protein
MRKLSILLGCGLGLALAARVTAHPDDYAVTPQAGPWMVFVASFEGQDSGRLAEEMVTTIRRDYKLPAYLYNRGDEERRKEKERVDHIREEKRKTYAAFGAPDSLTIRVATFRIEDQFAVLVGGYKDMDAARKALDQIRKLKPAAEKVGKFMVSTEPTDDPAKNKVKEKQDNPFATAFVAHNPTVPVEKDPEKGKLENLKEYNADESYSLLKCGHPYTLLVMTFKGASAIVPASGGESAMSKAKLTNGAQLNVAAKQAHNLAELLQKKLHYDAYVLHTESMSYVTVGGFDKADDPKLLQLQRAFTNPQSGPLGDLKNRLGQLMAQPTPMAVPKP